MDLDTIWATVDEQRDSLADLFGTLDADQWHTQSLCRAWRVRDVAAHLTLAQMTPGPAALALVRAGFGFDRMIRETARRQARLPVEEYAVRLRAMAGSRRKAPGVSATEPLLDVLVHGQDVCEPLGIAREMPLDAATGCLERAWTMGFPFFARRRLRGLRLVATDSAWAGGDGAEVHGRTQDLLLLVTGRGDAALPRLAGPGVRRLTSPATPAG